MPRSTKRASEATLDTLHRLTAKALVKQMRIAAKSPDGVSASLINSAISLLKVAEVTAPERRKKGDKLKSVMPDFDDLERGKAAPVPKFDDFTDGGAGGAA